MIRNILLSLVLILAIFVTARWLLNSPDTIVVSEEHGEQADFLRGPHNGRLLEQDGFAIEITIFETGVPPEFRIYSYMDDQPLRPAEVNLTVELKRTGNVIDRFEFTPEEDFLRGSGVVNEPHSFDVTAVAVYQGRRYQWTYQSYEGRTQIPDKFTSDAGIKTEIAGPAVIVETLEVTGRVEIDPNRMSQVRARFPGIIKRVHVDLGAMVNAGATLLTIESSESLQDYVLTAPISGQVIKRNVQAGEVTPDAPLFTIVDFSVVSVEMDVFANDTSAVNMGQLVTIETIDGYTSKGTIDLLSPLSSHASQSIKARVLLDNPENRLRPGQFVTAKVEIAAHEVPLAVKRSGVQGFRDFQVVFAKFGHTYEVRMLEFGITNDEWLEVVAGLTSGTEYVTENSYLIKADIEKSGASHDH